MKIRYDNQYGDCNNVLNVALTTDIHRGNVIYRREKAKEENKIKKNIKRVERHLAKMPDVEYEVDGKCIIINGQKFAGQKLKRLTDYINRGTLQAWKF